MITHRTRMILAGMIGNLVQSFDMAICGLLSIYFAKYLLGDTTQGLFSLFYIYLFASFFQPSGAIFLGLFSDSDGRKITFAISIIGMGITTAFIGLIPSYYSTGIFAIITLFVLRSVQSFFYGAEYLNATAYLIENVAESEKGFIGSWGPFGAMAGLLVASLFALIVSCLIRTYPHLEWLIWRTPFFIGLIGACVGLYVRNRIPESLDYIAYYADHETPNFNDLLKQAWAFLIHNKLNSFLSFVLICLSTTATIEIYIFSPIQAYLYGNLNNQQIFGSNVISLVVMLCVIPFIGKLSDKIKREKIIIASTLGLWFLSLPYYYILAYGNFGQLVLFQCLISIPLGSYCATVPVMILEKFPLHLRCTLISMLYAIAAGFSVGLVPLLSMKILKHNPHPITPTLLIYVLITFTWVGVWMMNTVKRKETKSLLLVG